MEKPVWLSTLQAAAVLGITTRTLRQFIESGEIVAYRMGRVIRLKEEDVEAFIETRKMSVAK